MSDPLSEFSKEQWAFLAVLDAFRSPVSIELAGNLAPVLPGPLIDLLEISENRTWIKKIGSRQLTISDRLPSAVRKKLDAINSAEHLSILIDRMRADGFEKRMDLQTRVKLMYRAGRIREAAELEINMAQQAFEINDYAKGRTFLHHAVSQLDDAPIDSESQARFIDVVLQLSNISFTLGKGFIEIDTFLHKAHEVSFKHGDKRSHALINLHLGRLYYFTDRREDALVALSLGAEEIEELDDSDIRLQSAPFLGLYFFLKGQIKEAFEHFEKTEQVLNAEETPAFENAITPIFFGYSAVYLGKFHRAIGILDCKYRLALERSDKALASTVRAVLGTVLVLLRKPQEASTHLNQALEDARETNNALGLYFCGGGVALRYFFEGQMEKAYEVLKQTTLEGSSAGLVRQFSSPWVIEMLYEFYRLGFDPIPEFEYPETIKNILNGVNIHLQGVALRLRAKEKQLQGDNQNKIAQYLNRSMRHLRKSGDPVQLSKTLLEMARLKLSQGSKEDARQFAQEARRHLTGYTDEFFPVEYQSLVENRNEQIDGIDLKEDFIDKYLKMIESLYFSESRDQILAKVLTETSRMFGAERSALFWFPPGKSKALPELRHALNLSMQEITTDNFKPSLNAIVWSFDNNTPLVDKRHLHESVLKEKIIRSILCIPIAVQHRVHGVLYYDNSYLENAFQLLNLSIIKRMARHTNLVVERRFEHLKLKKQVEVLSSKNSLRLESQKKVIITQAPSMIKLLELADKIAETESTVLIQGETGTGKELLAKRIYNKSQRAEAPLIVVDSTTIPENLLESELFGYEKGAFTGADNRKIGCIEMAHQGTLFFDEIGELTLQAQVKLLRALQEKKIRRVGGIQTIESNFRLIAATNRDMDQQVASGQFRKDLYYRLNVISFTLPPLRDRGDDAIYLAQHFIENYSKKYNQRVYKLSAEQEALIKKYTWPGNVRELKNKIESAVILSGEDRLVLDLPSGKPVITNNPFGDKPALNEIQRRYIRHIIEYTNGKISGPSGAIEILKMKRTSLYARMKALGMKR